MARKREIDSLDGRMTGDDAARVKRDDLSLGEQSTFGNEDSSVGDLDAVGGGLDDLGQVTDLTARYEIQEELGRGGMGVVQKAFDRRLKRTVAIKRLKGDISTSRRALQRFLVEAQAVASLNHFHIVQIYDFGRDPEGPFLILEFVPGRSLSDRLKDGPIPIEQAVELTGQLCEALAMAHRHGIIHRDIKPANVLLTANDEVKLTDFGLAKQDDRSTSMHTQTGVVLGTVDFMPPEQRRGATEVDARSDLWSVGATLYQMLTGRSPRVIRLDAVPESLRDIVGKSLEEDPARRFQTAVEFHRILRDAAEHGSGKVRSTSNLADGQCSGCGASNELNAKFCRGCGASLVGTCLSCEQLLSVWTRHCTHCGGNQTELLQQQRKMLEAIREQAEALQRDHQYEQALTLAKTTAAEVDPRLADSVVWVDELVANVQRESKQQIARRDEVLAEAQQFLKEYRYADAVRVLSCIPPGIQNKTVKDLSQKAQTCETEHKQLREEIQQRLRAKEYVGLIVKVRRSLELKPDSSSALSLLAKLEDREAKAEARRDQVLSHARQRWDKFDDEGVLKLLSQIPENARNGAVKELKTNAETRLVEAATLKRHLIDSSARRPTLNKVKKYLELRPHDGEMTALRDQLASINRAVRLRYIGLVTASILLLLVVCGVQWSRANSQRVAHRQAAALVKSTMAAAVLLPVKTSSISEESTALIEVAVTDPAALDRRLRFSFIGAAPAGCLLDAESGKIRWTPTEVQGPGIYPLTVEVIVTGCDECTNRTSFNLTVPESAQKPEFAPVGPIRINEETAVDLTISATTPDVPILPIRYSLIGDVPKACSIDAATGKLSWTPLEEQGPGSYKLNIRAEVECSAPTPFADAWIDVIVDEVNQPPVFKPFSKQQIREDDSLDLAIACSDPDIPANKITFSLLKGMTGALIDPDSGLFKWTAGSDAPRSAIFEVGVSDGEQLARSTFEVLSPSAVVANSIGMKLVVIRSGEFMMGSSAQEQSLAKHYDHDPSDEGPQHRVRITKPFLMGETEVTQRQWFAVMKTEPWRVWEGRRDHVIGADFPATEVSWDDAVEFCKQLSALERTSYRLPTEAEWEYACRAGTTTAYSCGNYSPIAGNYGWFGGKINRLFDKDRYSNTQGNEYHPHVVATKLANAFGLFDMHGNVREWCQDQYDKDAYKSRIGVSMDPLDVSKGSQTRERLLRGGSFDSSDQDSRSAWRDKFPSYAESEDIGFRVVR